MLRVYIEEKRVQTCMAIREFPQEESPSVEGKNPTEENFEVGINDRHCPAIVSINDVRFDPVTYGLRSILLALLSMASYG